MSQHLSNPRLNIIDSLGLDSEIFAALQLRRLRSTRRPEPVHGVIDPPAAAYFQPTSTASLQICGSAAELWFDSLADAGARISVLRTHQGAALLLAADAAHCPRFKQLAHAHFDGTLLASPLSENQLMATLRRWSAMQTQTRIVHGVLMQVHGLGLLLTGASGVGKSELALELISRGHPLVADDAVEVNRIGHGCLIGRSPALLSGFIEARGLGILNVRSLYGATATVPCTRIDLILELKDRDHARPADATECRLRGNRSGRQLLDEIVPVISLSPRLGHNLAVLAETGCRDHWLRLSGYHADAHFIECQQRQIDDAGVPPPKPRQ